MFEVPRSRQREGTRIGPDLTGVAVHSKEHLLIDILDPSRSVEGNFKIWQVTTLDGKKFAGLMASETRTSIEIIDTEAKKHVIQREDIDELKPSTKSLMPEGFEKQVKPQDIVDLLEFLTQKGKYLPIPLDKAATVVSTKGMFYSEDAGAERMIFSDWKPKTFDGVPFQLVDPNGDKSRNIILLNSPNGTIPPKMPKSVTVPCNTAAKSIHMLSGVSGWGAQGRSRGSVSMIVRLSALRGWQDRGPRTPRRRALRGLHRPLRRAGLEVRLRAPRPTGALSRRDAEARGGDQGDRIRQKGPDRTQAPIVVAVTVETKSWRVES